MLTIKVSAELYAVIYTALRLELDRVGSNENIAQMVSDAIDAVRQAKTE